MEIGNVVTLLTLFLTIILGISDISKRRAESKKLDAETKLGLVNADTQMMSQIKQASIDLVTQLKDENAELESDVKRQKEEVRYLKFVLAKAGIVYEPYRTGPLTHKKE